MQRVRSIVWPHRLLALLLLLAGTLSYSATAEVRERREVVPGVEYFNDRRAEGPLSIHVVKVDLERKELAVAAALAGGTVVGRRTVREIVNSWPPERGRPIAAVNGDYFEMGLKGDPRYAGALQGAHISDGELVHDPSGSTFWVDGESRPHLALGTRFEGVLIGPDDLQSLFRLNCSTTALPSEVRSADAVLFTPAFGPSTRTDAGLEFVLRPVDERQWLPLRVNRKYDAVIESVSSKGDTPIRQGTVVVSMVERVGERWAHLRPGQRVSFTTDAEPDLSAAVSAVSGAPPLVVNGELHAAAADRQNRHPRTAIGFNDTHLFLVVVDGRQPDLSTGMSHGELADLMKGLGCTHALNLDGGGSTTMWLDGKVVNSPSDAAGERAVGSAVVVAKRADAHGSDVRQELSERRAE